VLKLILQVLLAILVFRLIGSLFGLFRGGGKRKTAFQRSGKSDEVEQPDYSEITPYDIEDADYEEIPKRE
jgi:hypothetical protein